MKLLNSANLNINDYTTFLATCLKVVFHQYAYNICDLSIIFQRFPPWPTKFLAFALCAVYANAYIFAPAYEQ